MSSFILWINKWQPFNVTIVHCCNNDDFMASMFITNVIIAPDPQIIKLCIIGSVSGLQYHHAMTDCADVKLCSRGLITKSTTNRI